MGFAENRPLTIAAQIEYAGSCLRRTGAARDSPAWRAGRLGLFVLLACGGCQNNGRVWVGALVDPPAAEPDVREADTAFTTARLAGSAGDTTGRQARIDTVLRILQVQLPRSARDQTQALWAQLREDAVDSDTQRRLYENGVRVGVGRTERWEDTRATLESIAGRRVRDLPPLRTLPGVPLALELDARARDQTIFYLGRDGILSGETWAASQRVLRVTYTLDTGDPGRVFLSVVPEIRRRSGSDWAYTESRWTTGPRRDGRAFAAAAFAAPLRSGEFVVVAPGEKADVFGLVGGSFLKDEADGQPYDSYVFVRVDVSHVNERR